MAITKLYNFDNVSTLSAAGITAASGTWTIDSTKRDAYPADAPSTVSGGSNKVLLQTDTSASRKIARLTNNPDAPHFRMTAEIKILTDGTTYKAGFLFRGQNGSGYALELNASNNTVTLYNTAGSWSVLSKKTTTSGSTDYITTNTIYKVEIEVYYSTIKVYVNGVATLPTITDSTYTGMYFGFFTDQSAAWFDSVAIISLTSSKIVRTNDWIKGILFLEVKETRDTSTYYYYGTTNSNNALEEVLTMNPNTIQIVVPAHMHNTTSNEIWWDNNNDNHYDSTTSPTANDAKLKNLISSIHGNTYLDEDGQSQRVKAMLNACRFKLHDSDQWRGDLAPSNRSLWWDNYTDYILHYAQLAEEADAEYFVIGSELRSLEGAVNSADITSWGDLITAVRAVYSGFIVYSLSWPNNESTLEDVVNSATWLNDVDFIGVNGYFELVGAYSLLGTNATASATTITLPNLHGAKYSINTFIQIEDDLTQEINYITAINGDVLTVQNALANTYTTAQSARVIETTALSPGLSDFIRGWDNDREGDSPYEFLETLSTTFGKPIFFSELGYRSIMGAGMFPWFKGDPPTAKHANILTYETDTNNSWGWLSDNIIRDNTTTQENGIAAAFIRWWDVDWMHGICVNGAMGNPNDGFSTTTQGGFFDGDYCLAPQTKVLKSDLTWTEISLLKPGDELIGIEEFAPITTGKGNGRQRKIKASLVEYVKNVKRPSFKITLDNGKEIIASGEHPWLARRHKKPAKWVATKNLTDKDELIVCVEPWELDNSREAGYLAGFFDGEGWLSKSSYTEEGKLKNVNLGAAQVKGQTLEYVKKLLQEKNFYFKEHIREMNGNYQEMHSITIRKFRDRMRFMGEIRPERLMKNSRNIWENKTYKDCDIRRINSIEFIGDVELISLQTSTHTFVAEGLFTHNTILNKPAQSVITKFFAAPNVRDDFPTTTTYCTIEDVARLLQVPTFSSSTPITSYEVKRLIRQAEDWVDLITRSSWRPHEETEYYEFVVHGIKLNHDPIRSVSRVRLFSGNTFETKNEGRDADWWVDLKQGVIYFGRNYFVNFLSPMQINSFGILGQYRRPVEVTYTWGRRMKSENGQPRDKYAETVRYATQIWVAMQIIQNHDQSVIFPSGVDKIALKDKYDNWSKEWETFRQRNEKLFIT